jgi:hypothetical protein
MADRAAFAHSGPEFVLVRLGAGPDGSPCVRFDRVVRAVDWYCGQLCGESLRSYLAGRPVDVWLTAQCAAEHDSAPTGATASGLLQ